MKEIILSIKVQTNAEVTPDQVTAIIRRLIDAGLEDANRTIEHGEGDMTAAELATYLNISAPVVVTTPRVLIVVSGGIADPTFDDGVEVEVFDWDNYKDLDESDPDKVGVSAHFADLAESCGVPVELSEDAREAAEHVLKMAEKYEFRPDAESVRGAVEESANLLRLSLSEADIVAACDYVLDKHSGYHCQT